jgi:DNA-binding beta-propeller fold protein YncE
MKRSKTTDTKHNKKQKLSTNSEACKIIDTIDIRHPENIIQTPCGTFLIGVEGDSIFKYCLETRQKFRIAGSVDQHGNQDGTRDEARFNYPTDLTLSKDLKTLFVADAWNRVIRAICIGTGITTTFAGQVGKPNHVDGPKEKACFEFIKIIKLSPDGNTLIVVDDSKLRTICVATGQVNTIYTIGSFRNEIHDFSLSPDGKNVYISHWTQILKFNLETGKSEIILKGETGFIGCDLSKDGLLFISNHLNKEIKVVNIVTNQVIVTITIPSKPTNVRIFTNRLYICNQRKPNIQVLEIYNYCTNFKTFLQSQLFKYSFLSRAVVKRLKI